MKACRSFAEFWPFYVAEHAKAGTRRLHFAGTTLALACLVAFVLTLDWRLLVAAVVAGYAFAWAGHFFVEHNRPATFTYPFWSLLGDWKMWAAMLLGRMDAEVRKHAPRSLT